MRKIKVNWETDGYKVKLPIVVELPNSLKDEDISDWLSDEYGWLVNNWEEI